MTVYSCRRSGCGFFGETYQHATVTLVILNGWLGAATGQCEPKLVCRLSPPRPSTVIKNGRAVKPSTTSALQGIVSCSVFRQTPDVAFKKTFKNHYVAFLSCSRALCIKLCCKLMLRDLTQTK